MNSRSLSVRIPGITTAANANRNPATTGHSNALSSNIASKKVIARGGHFQPQSFILAHGHRAVPHASRKHNSAFAWYTIPVMLRLASLVLVCAALVTAQSSSGTITGVVTDTSEAALAGVSLRLVNADTG